VGGSRLHAQQIRSYLSDKEEDSEYANYAIIEGIRKKQIPFHVPSGIFS